MSSEHIIVGTAGHVDHGKTLLTAALTGVDTDRLPEEKKRGMTIVPGFVPLDLKSGRRLGLIDVPGHERFVKNMLAGVAGIDMVLLVIAADEGVMPQTVEHLNILHLLGISKGVVAITKCDLVEDEWLEMVHEQAAELLAPTSLKGSPMIDVSAVSGYHIEELKDLLDKVAATVQERPSTGLCRIPVDRVFTKQGFGTVITGTLWSGSVENGQRLQLLPSGDELRVRGLQVHNKPVLKALAGQRTAINLTGPGVEKTEPGCWLAAPGLLQGSYRLDVELDLLANARALAQRTRIRVFHGTMEVLGRVRLLDRETLESGQTCLCQLELESTLSPLRGDRVILRTFSPIVTIAGATVLDVSPPRYKLNDPNVMDVIRRKAELDTGETLLNILDDKATLFPLSALSQAAQLSVKETENAVTALGAARLRFLVVDGERQYYSTALDGLWRQHMLKLLGGYHKKYPLRRGMPAAELHQRIFEKLNMKQLSALLESYAAEGLIALPGSLVAKADFACTLTPKQKADLDAIEDAYRKGIFTPPEWNAVVNGMHISAANAAEYLAWLLGNDRLTRVGELFFASDAVRDAEKILRSKFTTFTMAEARDVLGSSRKYVLALLESFDARKCTVREGDSRRFLK